MHPLLPENIRFSDVFRGYRKGALGKNGLKKTRMFSIVIRNWASYAILKDWISYVTLLQ